MPQFEQKHRPRRRRIVAAAVVAGLAALALAEDQVVKHTVAVKSGKSSLAPIVLKVDAETRLSILKREGSFVQVKAPDGTVGWILGDDLPKPSKPPPPGTPPVDSKYAGAGRGLQDETLRYAGTKQTKAETVQALSDLKALGDAVSDDTLQAFADEQHLGPQEYRH